MTMLPMFMVFERALPFFLFALDLITAFRVCSYSAWRDAGAPNPFLPRTLKALAQDFQRKQRIGSFG